MLMLVSLITGADGSVVRQDAGVQTDAVSMSWQRVSMVIACIVLVLCAFKTLSLGRTCTAVYSRTNTSQAKKATGQLSRGRTAFLQHRAADRVRITLAQLASTSRSIML